MDPSVQVREPGLEVCLVVRPSHPIHARSGFAPEREERHSQRLGVDVVEERGEPFLPLVPRGMSTGSSPVAGSRAPAPGSRDPGSEPGACVAGSRSPRPPPFAPPAPPPVPRPCSLASSLLRRGLTSRVRASPATAPHLPGAGRATYPSSGQTRDLPGSGVFPSCVMGSSTTAERRRLA